MELIKILEKSFGSRSQISRTVEKTGREAVKIILSRVVNGLDRRKILYQLEAVKCGRGVENVMLKFVYRQKGRSSGRRHINP